ncbi:mucin-17-like isoform X2 [Gigantopelta aegis]|nr:mucin-17-like isoform X2 [Gigantopelta aegis]
MSAEEKSMSGKLVTGNDGNFMLLLDPLSEDKAVFTSVRCGSNSELPSNTESTDSSKIVNLTATDITSSHRQNGRHFHDTFLPNVQKNTGLNMQQSIGSVRTLVPSCTTTMPMVSSSATVNIAVSGHSTGTCAVPSGDSLSNIQNVHSKLIPNSSFINTGEKFYFPTSTPLMTMPTSKVGQPLTSSILSTPVMPASKSINSIPTQCCLTASNMLQSIVQAGYSATQVGNKQATRPKIVTNYTTMPKQNESRERNIQVVYPSTLNSLKGVKPNVIIIPSTTAQSTVVTTKPTAVPSTIFSHSAAAIMNPSQGISVAVPPTTSSQPHIFPLPATRSLLISPVVSSSVPQTSVIIPPSVPIVKQVTANSTGFANIIRRNPVVTSAQGSNLKTHNPCTSVPVTSRTAPSKKHTLIISSNPQFSNTDQVVLKSICPSQPVILKLASGAKVPIPAETIQSISKSKSSVAHIVITSPPRASVAGKEKMADNCISAVHTKQFDKAGSLSVTTSSNQERAFPPLQISNISSLPNHNSTSINVKTTKCQEKVTQSGQVTVIPENKSGITCSTKLADSLDPCYPVLEKLSDRQIAHIMSSVAEQKRGKCRRKLRSRNRPGDLSVALERKCSSYCRQRTLKFLCRLGMLKCRKVKGDKQTKTTSVTKPNVMNKDGNKSLHNMPTILQGISRSSSSLITSASVQNKPPVVSSVVKTGIEVGKLLSVADAGKGLQSKVIVNDAKGLPVPMQLVAVNNKLYLLPVSSNIGTPLAPSVFTGPLLNSALTTMPDVRSRLAAGVNRLVGRDPVQVINAMNQPTHRNIFSSLPTFSQSSTINMLPLSTSNRLASSLLSGSTVYSVQSNTKTGAPRGSQSPVVIQAPLIMKATSAIPSDSGTPASDKIGDTQQETKTMEKIVPWKLPWNYEIKSEPVTEGYGDEEESQKTAEVSKTASDQVMTIRLPFQKSAPAIQSAPLPGVSSNDVGGNTSNNATSCSSFQVIQQSCIPSKFVKTNQDLIVASSQNDRIQRLKEILREKEQMLEELKRKQAYFHL